MSVTRTLRAESSKSVGRSDNRQVLQTVADLEHAVLYSVIGGVARAQIDGFEECFQRACIVSCALICTENPDETGTSLGFLAMFEGAVEKAFVRIAVDHALVDLVVIESDRVLVDKMEQPLVALLWKL